METRTPQILAAGSSGLTPRLVQEGTRDADRPERNRRYLRRRNQSVVPAAGRIPSLIARRLLHSDIGPRFGVGCTPVLRRSVAISIPGHLLLETHLQPELQQPAGENLG